MPEADFAIVYDGPALETGQMPVRDLAPALLALGELYTEASKIVYPKQPPVSLNVKANERGSFLVWLALQAGDTWDTMRDLLVSQDATAIANLMQIVSGAHGMFWLIGRLNRRKIVAQQPAPPPVAPGGVRLTLEDGTTLEVSADVLALYERIELRRHARAVVAPLKRQGIEKVEFREDDQPELIIAQEDVTAYDLDEDEELLNERDQEIVLEIVSPDFNMKNKWRFSDGSNSTIWAGIEDADFVRAVEDGTEAFRKGDLIRVRVKLIQTRRPDGLHADYTILEVLDHYPRLVQLDLQAMIPPEIEAQEEPKQLPPGDTRASRPEDEE